MIKYLQLKRNFNPEILQREFRALENNAWQAHYNNASFEGDWSILALRSIGGSLVNTVAAPQAQEFNTPYEDTILLEQLPYTKEILESFACEKTAVRLMKLGSGAIIKEHSDHSLSFEEGEVRLHIPVVTNKFVEFYLEEERIPMEEGSCWYLNLSLNHRVNNFGSSDRVHLVIDCIVNDWLIDLFNNEVAVIAHTEPKKNTYGDAELQNKIRQELLRMNTTIALDLIKKMDETSRI